MNFGIQQGSPITVGDDSEWKPAVAYCRYAHDFVVIVKGTKAHADATAVRSAQLRPSRPVWLFCSFG